MHNSGLSPSRMGFPALGELTTTNSPDGLAASHTQPEPKSPAAAVFIRVFIRSNDPKLRSIASSNAPCGWLCGLGESWSK